MLGKLAEGRHTAEQRRGLGSCIRALRRTEIKIIRQEKEVEAVKVGKELSFSLSRAQLGPVT